MMSLASPQRLRVLVGAGSFADASAALRIVERLPDTFRTELGGVLVEEVDTLAAYQIPKQRIVLVNGTTILAPNLSQVHSLLKADAKAFRQSLARAADSTGAQWIFVQDKGELVSTALRAAAEWDILVIGYRQLNIIPGKIVLLEACCRSDDDMHEAARRLSPDRIVFSVKTHENDTIGLQNSNVFEFETLENAMRALMRTNAQAVLVDLTEGPIRSPDDLARLLEVSRCPLIVFGTSNTNTMLEHSTQIPPPPGKRSYDGAP